MYFNGSPVKKCVTGLLVSGLACKKLGGHHSALTACKKLNKLKKQQVFLDL